jgi:ubiquinone/menaquinone biosynthesis C-methylase UbiE
MDRQTTDSVRQSYNKIADEYARRYADELQHKPLDRELLSRFAVSVKGRGEVCDLGCGPGHIARYLGNQGVHICGLDLSPRMIDQARKLNPDIAFRVGNMMSLDVGDESLAGIVAFYAIVNIPESSLPTVFAEMWRVLKSGGRLLLSFHVGDEVVRPAELFGQPISMVFFFFQPFTIRRLLEAEGFAIEDVVEREPYSPDVEHQSRRAYILARKPGSPVGRYSKYR